MFTRKEQLIKKTGPDGIGRYEYLKQLVNEYYKTTSHDAKCQILANLANFAYDPINFEFIKQLHIADVFLRELSENSEELSHLALAALCNLSLDPESREYIIKSNGIHLISEYLLHRNDEIALNALTTLIFMITPETRPIITSPENINKAVEYRNSSNTRFKNLGTIFLQDFCTPEQIAGADTFKT